MRNPFRQISNVMLLKWLENLTEFILLLFRHFDSQLNREKKEKRKINWQMLLQFSWGWRMRRNEKKRMENWNLIFKICNLYALSFILFLGNTFFFNLSHFLWRMILTHLSNLKCKCILKLLIKFSNLKLDKKICTSSKKFTQVKLN